MHTPSILHLSRYQRLRQPPYATASHRFRAPFRFATPPPGHFDSRDTPTVRAPRAPPARFHFARASQPLPPFTKSLAAPFSLHLFAAQVRLCAMSIRRAFFAAFSSFYFDYTLSPRFFAEPLRALRRFIFTRLIFRHCPLRLRSRRFHCIFAPAIVAPCRLYSFPSAFGTLAISSRQS